MVNINEIKSRTRAVEQTRKITKAMHLISTVKMRRALLRYDKNATYMHKLRATIKEILLHVGELSHPFLEDREGSRRAFLVIAGDKGLCGSYNTNVLKVALKEIEESSERYIFTVGHMATQFFNRKNQMVDVEFLHTAQNPELENARQIADTFIDLYNQDMIDEVVLVYTDLESTVKQTPKMIKLLPLELEDFSDIDVQMNFVGEFSYEPDAKAVFNALVPQYIIGIIYAALVQSFASEQCARMQAMESSTDNADDMLKKLNQDYRRARQNAVTQEMLEIIGGRIKEI